MREKPSVSGRAEANQAASAGPQPGRAPADEVSEGFVREAVFETPSWLVSMVVHIVGLLVLALIAVPRPELSQRQQLVVAPYERQDIEQVEELDKVELPPINVMVTNLRPAEPPPARLSPEILEPGDDGPLPPWIDDPTGLPSPPGDPLRPGRVPGGGYSSDFIGRPRHGVPGDGSSGPSEAAVAAALKWLAEHQLPDGGWSFNHTLAGSCHGQCRSPGELVQARIAATGLALLPFLGAGQTHKVGQYRETVRTGLYFLASQMKVSPQGGSLYEPGGRMYSHGIASIALCEAYGMTHDRGLYAPAQSALNFIAYAQDPVGGGWRYEPRQRGDTSVVGWQIMSLVSGRMAYLQVSPMSVKKAFDYLDAVQSNNGANYGYTDPGGGPATTAIGLLCRMYLGWKHDNPALERGVEWLSAQGPSPGNMYYNYYATQVMRHWEGEPWRKWNAVMRDQLVRSQAVRGHEQGSWFMEGGDHGAKSGGRLYCTAMAAMVLEVYYRHQPLYRKLATEQDFRLD